MRLHQQQRIYVLLSILLLFSVVPSHARILLPVVEPVDIELISSPEAKIVDARQLQVRPPTYSPPPLVVPDLVPSVPPTPNPPPLLSPPSPDAFVPVPEEVIPAPTDPSPNSSPPTDEYNYKGEDKDASGGNQNGSILGSSIDLGADSSSFQNGQSFTAVIVGVIAGVALLVGIGLSYFMVASSPVLVGGSDSSATGGHHSPSQGVQSPSIISPGPGGAGGVGAGGGAGPHFVGAGAPPAPPLDAAGGGDLRIFAATGAAGAARGARSAGVPGGERRVAGGSGFVGVAARGGASANSGELQSGSGRVVSTFLRMMPNLSSSGASSGSGSWSGKRALGDPFFFFNGMAGQAAADKTAVTRSNRAAAAVAHIKQQAKTPPIRRGRLAPSNRTPQPEASKPTTPEVEAISLPVS